MDFLSMSYDEIIAYFRKKLPPFSDSRMDYSTSKECFVLNIWISYNNKLLLFKRSDKVAAFRGKRNCIGGYIDEEKTAEQKVAEEIYEELGITTEGIASIHKGKIHIMVDPETGRSRINYPVIVTLKQEPTITLDRENTEYKWINPEEINSFDTLPELDKSYEYAQK
ncbi:MAG: NUDIX domain-containing protein [candidate division SR1 bacterium]|nr:NUDIX domain-containing protein [candidate division SR1 bacterium]